MHFWEYYLHAVFVGRVHDFAAVQKQYNDAVAQQHANVLLDALVRKRRRHALADNYKSERSVHR